jgi:hypothetical protein
VEKRISGLKYKIEFKENIEESFDKRLKIRKSSMQENNNSIKRPNLGTMGIEEREVVQAKGICNIFNKIITENFPNIEKEMPIQVKEVIRTSNQNRTWHITVETTSIENKERILKAIVETKQITYKCKLI